MKTAMELMLERIEFVFQQELKNEMQWWDNLKKGAIEAEKEQIMEAFSDGQETPINHPTLPHYSREEYYNDNFNQKNNL